MLLLFYSCHAIDNPSMHSEITMLRQYGPNVPEETLSRLVKAFSELRTMADEGQIQVIISLPLLWAPSYCFLSDFTVILIDLLYFSISVSILYTRSGKYCETFRKISIGRLRECG